MTCRFALDDGAYVLGALAPAERADFERHLTSCAQCRKAVAGLAVLPGLLGRLDPKTAIGSVAAPPTLVPRALAAVVSRRRADRRRRRRYAMAAGLAAAILGAAVGVGVHLVEARPLYPGPALTAMRPVSDKVPVTAEVALVAADGGTRIEMRCRYTPGLEGQWTIRIVVYPRSGGAGEQIGSWTATADQEISVSAPTHLAPEDIARVELWRADDMALLTWTNV